MSSEHDISRRGFIAAGAAMFALASCDPDGTDGSLSPDPDAGAAAAGAAGEVTRLVGEVHSIDGQVMLLSVGGAATAIRLAPGAVLRNPMLGDVDVASLTRGAQVVAEARQVDGEWLATDLHVVFTHVEGRITSRSRDRLESSAGTLTLGPGSAPWEVGGDRRPGVVKPIDQIAVGDQIRALTMRDPATGELQVVRIITGEP